MQPKVLTPNEILNKLEGYQRDYFKNYLAMYSSWYGGIVRDPWMMMVPIDDHMVHRGDGIFEAIKVTNGGIYLLHEHLDRLFFSARKIGLNPPATEKEIYKTVLATVKEAKAEEAIIRLFIGRGVGSFSPNPYDPERSELYIVVTKPQLPSEKKYKEGVKLCRTSVPMKPGFFAQVKSLNYLPNVLMKKEAVDRDFDFAVGFDENGFLLEGATENLIILNDKNELIHPSTEKILKGTMMERLFQLVENTAGDVRVKRNIHITEKDLLKSHGAFLVGTSLDVIPVRQYEDHVLQVSKLSQKFLKLLQNDQMAGSAKLTAIE
jgi:4-amino-4-deoxychorismate lyase